MAKIDLSKLRNKAAAAAGKGKHKKALEIYLQLEEADPKDGAWARRAGEMLRHLGDTRGAIEAFTRACSTYADDGFLVKAVALCKIILRIDPTQVQAQEKLVALNAARGIEIRPKGTPPPFVAPTVPAGAGIDAIALKKTIPGAVDRTVAGRPSGICEIPLSLEMDLVIKDEPVADQSLQDTLHETPLFSSLSPDSLLRLIEVVEFVELPAGQALFHQGDAGSSLFVVVEGRVSVIAEGETRSVLGHLEEGAFFGEISLVTDQPRSATVEAAVDTELLVIHRHAMGELIRQEPEVLKVLLRFLRDRLVDNLANTSDLFAPFAGNERASLAARFGFLEVEAGSTLVKEGEVSPGLFIAMSGTLSVDRKDGGSIAELGAGGIFGEMSLLANAGAVASVTTKTKCLVLELPAKAFREVIMTHPQVLVFVGDLASERERQLLAVAGGEEQYEELNLDFL